MIKPKYSFRKQDAKTVLLNLCRVILAITFIFSGFVKSVDPWGTAIKIGEYLAAFDMEWLYSWRFVLAIWLNGAELMLGLMVLFGVRLRLTSTFIFLAMIFFTGLTLILAVINPIEDCGCFGEAIKLTNWETFIKNLILLPMSAAVFWSSRKLPMRPTWRDGIYALVFGSIAFGIGVYSYRHLPLMDFLPYKKGIDLAEAIKNTAGEGVEGETTVIYRNRQTGETREFSLADTTWYDDTKWEYVDTKTYAVRTDIRASVRDFAVFDNEGFVTEEILHNPGVVYMIFVSDPAGISRRCREKLENAVEQASARGYTVICLTAEPLERHPAMELGGVKVRCFNMDATTMKTILRAETGVVVLKNGVIADKANCRDLLRRGMLPAY